MIPLPWVISALPALQRAAAAPMKELWLQTRANNVIKPVCGWELTKLHIAESLQSTHYNIAPRDFFHPSNFSTQMPFRKQKNLFVGTVAIFFFFNFGPFWYSQNKKKKKRYSVLCCPPSPPLFLPLLSSTRLPDPLLPLSGLTAV